MILPCDLRSKQCLPCNDDPIQNITAEAPDVNTFISFFDFKGNPFLGVTFAQIACKTICFSTVSQRDADTCAQRGAQECVWNTWRPPQDPPIPPPPNGGPGSPWNTPGHIPPSSPRNPFSTFTNTLQICSQDCPDGQPFSETVDAGTIRAPSQAMADEQARSLACKRALHDRICFLTDSLPAVCLGADYSAQIQAEGGTPFTTQSFIWEIVAGDFPPGLDISASSGLITGIPFVNGSYTFTVRVTDAKGNHQSKQFTICVVEIVSEANLPDATEGDAYSQPLVEEPGTVTSEVWTVTGGALPDGITLSTAGVLSGTPTETGDFSFTAQVVANCSGSVTCSKSFELTVNPGVDCMGNPEAVQDIGAWPQISPGASGTITMFDGDGTYNGNTAFGPFVEARCTLCNPKKDAYDVTATFDWTVAGFAFGINTQAIFRVNGVDHASAVFNANGTYHFAVTVSLPSGVNTLNVYCAYTGAIGVGNLNGTVTVRPLAPP